MFKDHGSRPLSTHSRIVSVYGCPSMQEQVTTRYRLAGTGPRLVSVCTSLQNISPHLLIIGLKSQIW